jgi:TRAP-type C4-dicarboxylate transport system permease small subunit
VDFLRSLENRLVALEKLALAALLTTMVALSFVQVVLRGGFSAGFLWADTFLRNLVLWVGFLGAAAAAAQDKHFAMDAAGRILSGRAKAAAHLTCSIFTAAVCVLLLQASIAFLKDERAAANVLFSIGGWQAQAWPFELALPGGFALLAVHHAIKAVLAAPELKA